MRTDNSVNENSDVVDIGPLIEDMQNKINELSWKNASLLEKINDLYIRLEITSLIVEDCLFTLGIKKEDFESKAKEKVKEVVERLTVKKEDLKD